MTNATNGEEVGYRGGMKIPIKMVETGGAGVLV